MNINKYTPYHPDNSQVIVTNPHTGYKTIIEIWANPVGQYTVRAGASSEYSYTGFVGVSTQLAVKEYLLNPENIHKIFN